MANRTGNYCAFYVDEPFSETNLKAYATKDFVTYNLLRTWKGKDSKFPFVDSHDKNYDVRDDSDWEKTLKPRLHDRLNKSKNIILILSSITKNSRALKEEIDFGVNSCKLPLIVIYPEYSDKSDIADYHTSKFKDKIVNLWENLPILKESFYKIPTYHIPIDKSIIKIALEDMNFIVGTKIKIDKYFY